MRRLYQLLKILTVFVVLQIFITAVYVFSPGQLHETLHRARTIKEYLPSDFSDIRNLNQQVQQRVKHYLESMSIGGGSSGRMTSSPSLQNVFCATPPWTTKEGSFNLTGVRDTRVYFSKWHNLTCFIDGTNPAELSRANDSQVQCPCIAGWHGPSCSLPDSVWYSNYPRPNHTPRPRMVSRRIINAFPFNIEFEMLEARFAEIGDLVDVFLILESNYTAYGESKPLRLLDNLKQGFYNKMACKIVHVFLDYFPKEAKANGWLADDLHRNYITMHGLAKQLIGYSHDDIFLLSDADEIPKRETLVFLKTHDGYPEPVGINLRSSTYGFYWMPPARPTVHVISAVTMGLLTHVFTKHAIWIRSAPHHLSLQASNLHAYLATNATTIRLWSFGNDTHPAGWHCSWCCPSSCILVKLLSAQNGDFPRWGDFPEKRNLTYIRGLIWKGMWFDNKSVMSKRSMMETDYAPSYLLENIHKYKHILVNEKPSAIKHTVNKATSKVPAKTPRKKG